jgi:hypothetical protein
MPTFTVQERIESSLSRCSETVFLRRDFNRFGGYDQVGRALNGMVARGLVVRAGHGIYVKARKSSLTGNPVQVEPLAAIGAAVLAKLGVEARPSSAAADYAAGRTTQMPMADALRIGKARVSRKIGFGSKVLRLDR